MSPPSKKTSSSKKASSNKGAPKKNKDDDSLLSCLVFLTRFYGRSKSAESLRAGLPYDERGMSPKVFCESAERLGIKTQVVNRENIKKIPEAVLPVILICENDQAVILLKRDKDEVLIYAPDENKKKTISLSDLKHRYAGYAIFVQPRSEFHNPESVHKKDIDRHWFWSVVEENKGIYMMVMVAAIFVNLFALVSPLFIMNVYDRVIPNNAIETGWALGIGALTIFVFDLILRTLRGYLIDIAGRRIDVIAARRIYDQVLNMQIGGKPKSSGVFANMLRDFDTVRDFFTSATITGVVDLPFTLLFLFVIYQIGGGIALLLVGLIIAVLLVGYVIQFPLKALVRKATQSSEAKHGLLVETIQGLETIKSIVADGRFRAKYGDHVAESAAYGQGTRFVSSIGVNAASFVQQTASIMVVLMGMYMVQDAALTVGGLIACVILAGRAIAPIGQVANLMTRYHHATSALRTVENIMDMPVERPHDNNFLHRPELKGKITFDQVDFTYPGTDRKILNGVSFTINKGEKVGIIGRVGSGKSTIARLMMGLYNPEAGTALIDDTDYRQVDPADLRRHMAYIAQDVVLFSGTVRDNIAASTPQATDEDVLQAAEIAGVHDFVSRHPMGYDAPIWEHGEGVSGGQRQAIALARAALLKPEVLVCDEPTNAMDTQSEAAFRHYVQKDIKGSTLILITHKHSLMDIVDRLILVDQGNIILDGKRDEVIAALSKGKVQVPT